MNDTFNQQLQSFSDYQEEFGLVSAKLVLALADAMGGAEAFYNEAHRIKNKGITLGHEAFKDYEQVLSFWTANKADLQDAIKAIAFEYGYEELGDFLDLNRFLSIKKEGRETLSLTTYDDHINICGKISAIIEDEEDVKTTNCMTALSQEVISESLFVVIFEISCWLVDYTGKN